GNIFPQPPAAASRPPATLTEAPNRPPSLRSPSALTPPPAQADFSPTVAPAVTEPNPASITSPTPICNQAAPGNPIDISIPDDTSFLPGQAFTKTWRLVNTGSCSWTSDYAAVWFSGQTFGAPPLNNLTGPVAPGKSIDISLDMVAPDVPGTYQSNWKLKDKAGHLFGIGPTGSAPFWVRIIVSQPQEGAGAATQEPSQTPQVYATGLANLTPNDGLDLDQIKLNQDKADDLVYQVQKNSQHSLTPRNGAQMAQAGRSQPSLADCQAIHLSTDAQVLDGVVTGMYYCFKTNLGLPGWTRLVYLSPQDQVLTLEILTWSTP
ncbi:MAG TPA: NBR1-Ig-like domain-containing protein, partial [Anaerolineaceae bacterium]